MPDLEIFPVKIMILKQSYLDNFSILIDHIQAFNSKLLVFVLL